MSFCDEVQMKVTKTVQNVPLLHGCHMGTKSWMPLVHRVIDDALLQTVPYVNQTLLQIVNVSLSTVLHRTSHLVVNRSAVRAVWRLQTGSNARQPHGPCGPVGALSCWTMKKSPEIARISGSITCFSSTPGTCSPIILSSGSANMRCVKNKNSLVFLSKN